MTNYETDGSWIHRDTEGIWWATVFIETFKYVDFSGISNWSVGEILDTLNGGIAFINELEGSPVDPQKVGLYGKSVVSETLQLSYRRLATEEEIAEHEAANIRRKADRKNELLAELEELGDI